MTWRTRFGVWLLVAVGLLCTPLVVTAQDGAKKDDKGKSAKKDDKPKNTGDKKEEKPVFIGTLAGRVNKIVTDDEGTTIFLEITNVSQQLQRMPVRSGAAMRRGGGARYNYIPFIVPRETKQEVHIDISEDTMIRIPPKPEVDDKGRIVNKPQLKRDRNDPEYGLPGVKGDVTDLNRGQILRISLGRMKDPTNDKQFLIVTMMVEMLHDPNEVPPQGRP